VNLHIRSGDFFTFLGPSGCGKTTLLRMIAGFTFPDEGAVMLDGEVVNTAPPWKRDVGLVFQSYALWPHMSIFDNVAFGLRERGVGRSEVESRVREALRMVNLEEMERRRPSQLSGGQQQRVALARTLVVKPRVLLLDEPLSNLDAKLRAQMRIELLKLQRDLGITTVYVTHDQEEALALSNRIAVMSAGTVVQEGTPREIYEAPRNRFVAEFVGASSLLPAEVVEQIGPNLRYRLSDSQDLRGIVLKGEKEPAIGSQVLLHLRPEALDVSAPGSTSENHSILHGRVITSIFQGATVEYEVEVSGHLLRAHLANPKGKLLFHRGDLVEILIAPADVNLIPERE